VGSFVGPVARVSLQDLISYEIFVVTDAETRGNLDVEETRHQLFSLAGRLRELSQFAEDRARLLRPNMTKWRETIPDLELVDSSENK
jgi:hypothetical protein